MKNILKKFDLLHKQKGNNILCILSGATPRNPNTDLEILEFLFENDCKPSTMLQAYNIWCIRNRP